MTVEAELVLPLRMVRSVDLRKLKEPGVVLPVQPRDPIVAITIWDDSTFAVLLNGPHAFSFFKIEAQTRFSGLFVPAPEIIVTVESAVRSQSVWEQTGVLVLEDGYANVQARRAGEHWPDPVKVPLWQEVSCDEGDAIAFTRWSLRVTDGTQQRTLWQSTSGTT